MTDITHLFNENEIDELPRSVFAQMTTTFLKKSWDSDNVDPNSIALEHIREELRERGHGDYCSL